jgi:signal transduction histidine kinase/ActR/RegA family two-component response regulator
MRYNLAQYMNEPIIRMLLLLILIMFSVAGIVFYSDYYVVKYHEKPGEEQLDNLKSKDKLSHIINKKLLLISSEYQALLLTKNIKQQELLYHDILELLTQTENTLNVLAKGGTIVDVQLVNFLDKNELQEEITWKNDPSSISVNLINIIPLVSSLRSKLSILNQLSLTNSESRNQQFEVDLTSKQIDTLLLRLREATNKIVYDVSLSNRNIRSKITESRDRINRIVKIVNTLLQVFVLLVVIAIIRKTMSIIFRQKEADVKQKKANDSLTTLVENLPFGVFLVDKTKTVRMINKTALELMDCKEGDIVNHICHNNVCPAEKDNCPVLDLGAKVDKSEKIVLGKNNVQIPVIKSVLPININDEDLLLEAFVDITEQKKNEQSIKRLYRMNERLLHSIPLPLVIIDKDMNLLYTNDEAKLFSKDGDFKIEGKKCWQLLTNDQQTCDSSICPLKIDLQPESTHILERNDIIGNRIFQISCVPIEYNGQEAIMELFFDLTQEKDAQEMLLTAKLQAEEATKSKSEFLASMSHEIRTPMNAIIAFTDMLLETKMTSDQVKFASSVNDAGNNLMVLINDILDLSKIDAGKLDIEAIDFDLEIMVQQLVSINSARAAQKGLELCFSTPALTRNIVSDPYRIKQIITNLIGNALKFTEHGKVELALSVIEENNERVVIDFSVTDTGIGIPLEKQNIIFESFSQADGSTTRNYGGTGLGLSISNKLVSLLGGTNLQLSSEIGVGSTFSFRLALPFSNTNVNYKNKAIEEHKLLTTEIQSCHILVVEDNKINTMIARLLLEKQGHTVVCAENGELGVKAAISEEFDFCLMDMQMPIMDGLTATREIRKLEVKQKLGHSLLPIFAMTANAMKGDREICLDAGMDDYLTKPVKIAQINEVIRRHIQFSQSS